MVNLGSSSSVAFGGSGHYRTLQLGSSGKELPPTLLDSLEADGDSLYLRIETWGSGGGIANGVLREVAEGEYDKVFETILSRLAGRVGTTFLLFNPEMEVPAGAYPWQQYPSRYTEAYGHFARLARRHFPAGQLVWTAAGYPGADEFFPVDHPVDWAAVIMNPPSETGLQTYPRDSLAWRDAYRRVHRLRYLGLPILVFPGPEGGRTDFGPNMAARVQDKLRAAPVGTYTVRRSSERSALPARQITIGLYDPQQRLLDRPEVAAEHLFVDFRNLDNGKFGEQLRAVTGRGHDPIVTFEPLYLPDGSRDENVLNRITEGAYDAYLTQLFDLLDAVDRRIYFRYAHEMEIPIHRYPWQSQDPHDYVRSWRYVMGHPELPDNIVRVWGPTGDRGALEWYPGDAWVDMVSMAIYGLPDKNITDPRKQEPFSTILDRKWRRLRFLDKPLFITEFGVKGPEDYQTRWLLDAATTLRQQPGLVGVNYFNMSDTPQAWGEIKPPDWSITEETFARFVQALDR
jgi:beta-mannanase